MMHVAPPSDTDQCPQVSGCSDRLLQVVNNVTLGRVVVHRLSCLYSGKAKWDMNFDASIIACIANRYDQQVQHFENIFRI